MTHKKRQMLLVPQVNPASFVFFFEKGSTGQSWSVRDYSIPNSVRTYRPGDLPFAADDFFLKASHAFDAPTQSTTDLEFWHAHTVALNQKFGLAEACPPRPAPLAPRTSESCYPVLALDELLRLPKARKAQDMDRILHSANSEDWVTWNFFQLLTRQWREDWWGQIVEAARRKNPALSLPAEDLGAPAASFWPSVRSPQDYLEHSRRRMINSRNPVWCARAAAPEPVEGSSEIDVRFETPRSLVYIEAKLGSDISMSTTYDPGRNQIARNIDCLLENAGQKTPAFWMLVRDEDPSRAYVQLINAYKSDPGKLARDLPHRNREDLECIAGNLTVLRWSDSSHLLAGACAEAEVAAVQRELAKRIAGRGTAEALAG